MQNRVLKKWKHEKSNRAYDNSKEKIYKNTIENKNMLQKAWGEKFMLHPQNLVN